MKETMLKEFKKVFGDTEGVKVFFAPGRVNLIGEHTDYNGGHVFPCALTIGTYGAARLRNDRKLRFYSMNFEQLGVIESELDGLKPEKEAYKIFFLNIVLIESLSCLLLLELLQMYVSSYYLMQ